MKKILFIVIAFVFAVNAYSQEVGIKVGAGIIDKNLNFDDSYNIARDFGIYYTHELKENLNISISYINNSSYSAYYEYGQFYPTLLRGHDVSIDLIYDINLKEHINLKVGLGTAYIYNKYYFDTWWDGYITYSSLSARAVFGLEYKKLFNSRFSLELLFIPEYSFKIHENKFYFETWEFPYFNNRCNLILGVKFDLIKDKS